jgi:hypothetical protein
VNEKLNEQQIEKAAKNIMNTSDQRMQLAANAFEVLLKRPVHHNFS